MNRPEFHIIASNLHHGGGVQVAASLLDEMAAMAREGDPRVAMTTVEASDAVMANILPSTRVALKLDTVNRRPTRFLPRLSDLMRRRSATLIVFGPIYSTSRTGKRIMGYADVTSVYQNPVGATGVRSRLRARFSRIEVTRQDLVIVETGALAEQLKKVLGSSAPEVEVISNAPNSRVLEASTDEKLASLLSAARRPGEILLGYPTRPYPHKNMEYLPQVAKAAEELGLSVRFVVTLRAHEWLQMSELFRSSSVNVGEVSIDQVATLIRAVDGVFFPSLLEAFSATPVEALALGCPLLASDRAFVRAITGDSAIYFDPLNPMSGAEAVKKLAVGAEDVGVRVASGRKLVSSLPTARDRASRMLALLWGEK